MVDDKLLALILDSLKDPVLFADTAHITRYMNKAAIAFYDGGADLVGRSLMDCHNENSRKMMRDLLADLQSSGDEEKLFSTKEKEKVFMRAVRDGKGKLLGYYERYEKTPQED
jgi:DUF438 domain-containing protein